MCFMVGISSTIFPALVLAEGNLPDDIFPDLYWGFVYEFTLVVKDANEHIVDISDWTIVLEVKENMSDSSLVTNKTCTVLTQSGTTKGQCFVSLSVADTKWIGGEEANGEIKAGTTYYAYVICTDEGDGVTTRKLLKRSYWKPVYG